MAGRQKGRPLERMKRKDNAETLRTPRSAGRPRRSAGARRKLALTPADLVLLSLLAERPMRWIPRRIWNWSGGRSGIGPGFRGRRFYYSLEKLERTGMIALRNPMSQRRGRSAALLRRRRRAALSLANALEPRRVDDANESGRRFSPGLHFSWLGRQAQSKNKFGGEKEFLKRRAGTGRGNAYERARGSRASLS